MATIATRRNVLLLSLLLALLTSFLVYRFLQEQKREKTVVKVPVVVANREIAARDIIHPNDVSVRFVSGDQVHGDVCSSLDQVVDKAALVKIDPDTLISTSDVGEATINLGLAYGIPSYMRAVTVGIDEVSGVAGFLKPRDHVDVIGAFQANNQAVAKTVLQDVELLALGSDVQQDKVGKNSGQAKPARKTTATLIVTPKDAERLVLADTQGKLRLVLRSPGDMVRVATSGAKAEEVTGIHPRAKAAPAPPASKPSVRTAGFRSVIGGPRTPARPGIWGVRNDNPQPRVTPLSIQPVQQPKREVQVIRGNKVETVQVEDRSKAPKTNKEVPAASANLWLTGAQ